MNTAQHLMTVSGLCTHLATVGRAEYVIATMGDGTAVAYREADVSAFLCRGSRFCPVVFSAEARPVVTTDLAFVLALDELRLVDAAGAPALSDDEHTAAVGAIGAPETYRITPRRGLRGFSEIRSSGTDSWVGPDNLVAGEIARMIQSARARRAEHAIAAYVVRAIRATLALIEASQRLGPGLAVTRTCGPSAAPSLM
jgi:hypothetical protein